MLNFDQAAAAARAMVDSPPDKNAPPNGPASDRELYIDYKRAEGAAGQRRSQTQRGAHPDRPGRLVVAELTAERLRRWLATMAASQRSRRPKAASSNTKPAPDTDKEVRSRRATANRVLTMLKATLNHATTRGSRNRDAWGRKLKPFRDVEMARIRYLTVAEAKRLINAADTDFRPLVIAALETGCRYSELTRLEVQDFNRDAGTVAIRKSKKRQVSPCGVDDGRRGLLQAALLNRIGNALMFRINGGVEKFGTGATDARGSKKRPYQACGRLPHLTPHLGSSGRYERRAAFDHREKSRPRGHEMVEKHYGHLAPSYIAEAIRVGAPRFTAARRAKRLCRSGKLLNDVPHRQRPARGTRAALGLRRAV